MALKTTIPMILAGATLAACNLEGTDTGTLRNVSPAALAALPQGMNPDFLIRDGDGCYGIAIEAAEVPSGPPLRDAFGNVVCDA